MWEFSVSINENQADALKSIESRLRPHLTAGKGVLILDFALDRAYLSVACGEGEKAAVINELKEAVGDIITVRFKENYLLRNSRLPKGNKINYNAFIRALVAFDREWDRELVYKNLRFRDELLLDGFFNFRLKELKAKWQEVCDLASDNSGYLEYHDTFVELLDFLVKSIDSKCERVYIEKRNGEYRLCDGNDAPLDRAKLNIDAVISDETLLPNLIGLAPKEVFITGEIPEYVRNLTGCLFKVRS